MKNKRKACSTGHGTGLLQEASLGERLKRDKEHLLVKQFTRASKHPFKRPSKKIMKILFELQKEKAEEFGGFSEGAPQ